jgi:DNA-binding beta-propeller fold protein YncE
VCGLGALLAAGCASAPATEKPRFIRLTWPEAPETPRIVFERWFSSERHLGHDRSFMERLSQVLVGTATVKSYLEQPMDVAVSDDGNLVFVSDFTRGKVFRFDLEAEKVTAMPGDEMLGRPFGIDLDATGNLYVVEQAARAVRVLSPDGKFLRSFTDASLVRPADLAIDRERALVYVADPSLQGSTDHSVKVFDLEGRLVRTLGSGRGLCETCLLFPTYVAVGNDGKVYVTSTIKARVDIFDAAGNHVGSAGERGTGFGMFDRPKGVTLDSFGNLYVVDSGWSNVQIFNPKGQVLLFFGGRGDYPGLLKNPTGIAIDKNNRIYVADYLNNRVTVYQLANTTAEDSFLQPGAAAGGGAGANR